MQSVFLGQQCLFQNLFYVNNVFVSEGKGESSGGAGMGTERIQSWYSCGPGGVLPDVCHSLATWLHDDGFPARFVSVVFRKRMGYCFEMIVSEGRTTRKTYYLPGDLALRTGGAFWWISCGLRFLGNKAWNILENTQKYGGKFGTKIRKIRGTFVLQLFWPKNLRLQARSGKCWGSKDSSKTPEALRGEGTQKIY